VGTTSGNAGSPPHPPGGGGTPPPNPPKTGRAARWEQACALEDGDYVPTAVEVRAADDFLQDLPGRWQCGPAKARDIAPLLASRVKTQGYDLDDFLALELIRDDPNAPARNPVSTLPHRIRDLKRHRSDDKTPTGPSSGLPDWCGVCNRGEEPRAAFQRFRELPDGSDEACKKCHPKYARKT
jgi:hypothetical protein